MGIAKLKVWQVKSQPREIPTKRRRASSLVAEGERGLQVCSVCLEFDFDVWNAKQSTGGVLRGSSPALEHGAAFRTCTAFLQLFSFRPCQFTDLPSPQIILCWQQKSLESQAHHFISKLVEQRRHHPKVPHSWHRSPSSVLVSGLGWLGTTLKPLFLAAPEISATRLTETFLSFSSNRQALCIVSFERAWNECRPSW